MLFDPFEEQFDLPPVAINGRHRERREKKVVRQEDEAFVDFFRVIADPAQRNWIEAGCFGAG